MPRDLELRAGTFNIHHGEGLDRRVDLARTAKVIRKMRCDVLALQELDRNWPRSGHQDQPRRLAELTGLRIAFHPTFTRGEAEYGIALATPEPVQTRFVQLPGEQGAEPRGALVSDLGRLTVVATHLAAADHVRVAQVEALADLVREAQGPVLLLGDLNDTPRGLSPLWDAGLESPGWLPPTAPALRPWRQIDIVAAGRGARVRGRRSLWTGASDHHPVTATVSITS